MLRPQRRGSLASQSFVAFHRVARADRGKEVGDKKQRGEPRRDVTHLAFTLEQSSLSKECLRLDSGALLVKIATLASKALVAELRDERLGLWGSMSHENRVQAALCDTDDYREGFAAFQQKRRPEFTGGSRRGTHA